MREAGNVFWTLTVWSDAKAMEKYRTADAHRAAMPKLLNWCDEASLGHWTQDSADVPTWSEAHERMVREGRASKVNHPTARHVAHELPAPRAGKFAAEMRPRGVQRSA